jgi:hypothetical protein
MSDSERIRAAMAKGAASLTAISSSSGVNRYVVSNMLRTWKHRGKASRTKFGWRLTPPPAAAPRERRK